MKNRNFATLLLVTVLLLVQSSAAQEGDETRKTYFQNLFLDHEGHICYTEMLDKNPLNRLEYRTDGREIIGIFFAEGELRTRVEITDFDADGKADLVYIEKDLGERNVTKVNFFRGAQYQEHLKKHFGHALRTATHPLIKDEPEEVLRAQTIREGLALIEKTKLEQEDMGVYSSEGLFRVERHKDIQFAFVASDTLSNALRIIVEGDYRILSQEPQIVKKYNLEIGILTRIDPSVHASVKR